MPNNCIIDLPPAVVNKARANAHKQGKSLREVIEDAVVNTALDPVTDSDAEWITEKELQNLPWAPSRVTLYGKRKSGELKKGEHYKKTGRAIYYNRAEIERKFNRPPGEKTSEAGATDGVTASFPELSEPYGPDSFGGEDFPSDLPLKTFLPDKE